MKKVKVPTYDELMKQIEAMVNDLDFFVENHGQPVKVKITIDQEWDKLKIGHDEYGNKWVGDVYNTFTQWTKDKK